MKQLSSTILLAIVFNFFAAVASYAQTSETPTTKKIELKTYLIQRDIPGAGQLTPADLKGISQKSCSVLKEMGPNIVWVQSYVTGNNIFCVYQAENETLLREHAKKGGFPITSITEINSSIGPKTAE